jgi:hypothetical protein
MKSGAYVHREERARELKGNKYSLGTTWNT